MSNLPAFYADNVRLIKSRTINVRGNVATNIVGGTVKAFDIKNCENVRVKNNRAHKIRSLSGTAVGFNFDHIKNAVMVYNTCSRAQVGFNFNTIQSLNFYNATAHLCNTAFMSDSSGTFRNIAISSYSGYDLYKKATGFYVSNGTINLDYCLYYGLSSLVEHGSVTLGDTIIEDQALYLDELNDDLTPDYISVQIGAGTENPLRVSTPDIGGVQSKVTSEETAAQNYWYDLIDNSFWDIENEKAAEVSFIKAFQSRVAAASDVATTQVKKDVYIKIAESVQRFAEVFPAYIRYETQVEYNKRVADLWFASQNPATVQSYQNGIGGYNLLPSFFRHMQAYADGWIVNVSYIAHDNWLGSMQDLRYGMGIDVLGISTLNQATSGECYTNIMNCIADIAPVRWFLHEEVQPTGYVVFTDMWNGFENCTLTNMLYNDNFGISIDDIDVNDGTGKIITPLISTENIATSSVSSSGQAVEVSLLDRVWSESISRDLYWRQGHSTASMSSWELITDPIGGVIYMNCPYLQFRVDISEVKRSVDYEFQGIALRGYTSTLDWNKPVYILSEPFFQLMPGDSLPLAVGVPPGASESSLSISLPKNLLSDTGVSWHAYIPESFRYKPATIRFFYMAPQVPIGDVLLEIKYSVIDDTGSFSLITENVTVTTPGVGTVGSFDINVNDFDNENARQLYLELKRKSTEVGDTYGFGFDVLLVYIM